MPGHRIPIKSPVSIPSYCWLMSFRDDQGVELRLMTTILVLNQKFMDGSQHESDSESDSTTRWMAMAEPVRSK